MSDTQVTSYPRAVALVKTSGQSLSHTARHVAEKRVVPSTGASMDLAAEMKPWRGDAVNAREICEPPRCSLIKTELLPVDTKPPG